MRIQSRRRFSVFGYFSFFINFFHFNNFYTIELKRKIESGISMLRYCHRISGRVVVWWRFLTFCLNIDHIFFSSFSSSFSSTPFYHSSNPFTRMKKYYSLQSNIRLHVFNYERGRVLFSLLLLRLRLRLLLLVWGVEFYFRFYRARGNERNIKRKTFDYYIMEPKHDCVPSPMSSIDFVSEASRTINISEFKETPNGLHGRVITCPFFPLPFRSLPLAASDGISIRQK